MRQDSHWHFDHIGDPSTFPPTTELVVGPGTSAAKLPPWPENPSSTLTESDIKGRHLREISQNQFTVPIGRFRAFDFFGDGSFYLLDVPGHAVGHICGLAQTTFDSFILMGADTCHHGGQFRPSKYLPLPEKIMPHPNGGTLTECPCSIFKSIHPSPTDYRTERFYKIRTHDNGTSVANDVEQAEESIRNLQEFDAAENVLVVCAHDASLIGAIELFPKYANCWERKKWKQITRWRFLGDWKVEG
jgi:glyoxylase-like metal-dependent hydrolase (beta-lactamase superfamily II)